MAGTLTQTVLFRGISVYTRSTQKDILSLGLLVFVGVIACIYFKPVNKDLSYALTNVMFIRFSLLGYAQKHDGLFPTGRSSTEIFQALIDDHDLKPSYVYFDLFGKTAWTGEKLKSENVCYDFTLGTDPKSPDWVPIVFPTGFAVNYGTGEAERLSSNRLQEDVMNVAYAQSLRTWSLNRFCILPTRRGHLFITPDKPATAPVTQYQQLTPEGRL